MSSGMEIEEKGMDPAVAGEMSGADDVSISTDAEDLEGMFFADDNAHEGSLEEIEVDASDAGIATDPKKQSSVDQMKKQIEEGMKAGDEEVARVQAEQDAKRETASPKSQKQKKEDMSDDELLAVMMKQPFNIVMENFGITSMQFTDACKKLFMEGHYSVEINLMGLKIVLRSKNMNNHVDFGDYMRRILINQVSQREFETLRQLRQLAYAIIQYGDDDWTEKTADEKFDLLLEKDEMAITMIINASVDFWRISHLMMHPGALGFLESKPQT